MAHYFRKSFSRFIGLMVVMSLVLSPTLKPTFAADPSPTPSSSSTSTTNADPCSGGTTTMTAGQLKEYCAAAKSEKEAARNNKILTKVWAAVAVVCTAAAASCLTPIGAVGVWAAICDGANLAGGITDAVMTQQYASAMMSMMSTGMSYMMKEDGYTMEAKQADGKTPDSPKTKKNENKGCMMAAMNAAQAGIQCFMKNNAANKADNLADNNLKAAQSLTSTANNNASGEVLGGTGSMGRPAPEAGSGVTATANSGDPCSVAQNSGDASAHISCALSQDSNLPRGIGHPNFPQEFQKLTGKSLGQFLSQDNPKNAIGGALGGMLNADGNEKLASLLDSMEAKSKSFYATDMSGGSYASAGGGGGDSGGGEAMPDFNSLMSGLMDQVNPGAKEMPPGLSEVDFAQLKRAPAQVVEDKSLSIFTRISFRYFYVGKRVLLSGAPTRGTLK